MPKVYVYIGEPLTYSKLLAPVQILIQIRTWGRATHTGILTDASVVEKFIRALRQKGELSIEKVEQSFLGLEAVSATFPSVSKEQLIDYKGYRIFLKSAELTETQYTHFFEELNRNIKKKKYSIVGLFQFAFAPFVDWLNKCGRDVAPKHAFCSEFVTNLFWSVGYPLFDFTCDDFEFLVTEAHRIRDKECFFTSYRDKYPSDLLQNAWDAAADRKLSFGYKVSPKMVKWSKALKPEVVFDITEDRITLVQNTLSHCFRGKPSSTTVEVYTDTAEVV